MSFDRDLPAIRAGACRRGQPAPATRMSPAIGEHAVLHTIPSLERTIRELRAELDEERQARMAAERQVAELRSRIRHLDVCGVTTSDDGGVW